MYHTTDSASGVAQPALLTILLLAAGMLLAAGTSLAQGDPGPNVNIIGLTLDENDIPDLFFRQQNEPSCAIRPGDAACIICAYNDYRTVDVFGDGWQGVSQSCDAGDSWLSRIAPGSPADTVAPLPAAFAADPRFQHIPGLAVLNFIAGYRDSNQGVLAVQHWLEVNKEDADHYEPGRITYIADEGTEGRFLDKPDMVAVLDLPRNQQLITLNTPMENTDLGIDGIITRQYPSGLLYVGYAVFTGSNSIKVLVKTSDDWGQTWRNQAMKLSEDQNEVSGLSLTAAPDGKVVAIWRRRGDNNDSDAIMYSVISNGGKKATKGAALAEVCAFDQPTLGGTETPELPLIAFRTNDFPWAANDGDNFFAFYSERGRIGGVCDPNGRPRIVVHHSNNGLNWSAPTTVDDDTHPDSFQFMPTAFAANGKVQVAWYDTRREAEELAALTVNKLIPYVADHADIDLTSAAFVQRKVDVYSTSLTIDQLLSDTIPSPVRVSQYSIVVADEGEGPEAFETEASFANKKLFKQGTLPFLGDYIAMAARQFRKIIDGPQAGKWESNADFIGGVEDFFAAWTDNRDVVGEIPSLLDSLPYSAENVESDATPGDGDADGKSMLADSPAIREPGPPRDGAMLAEGLDGDDIGNTLVCSPGSTSAEYERSRDANIYGSVIKDRVRLFAPTPSKPLGGLQRAFVIALANSENEDRAFTLSIDDQPCDSPSACRASFRQLPTVPNGLLPTPFELVEQLVVPANSTLVRTVFVVGTATRTVPVSARDQTGALLATVALGDSAILLNPDVCTDPVSCGVADAELHNLTLGNLTLGNLTLANQDLLNLTLGNLTLGNLTLGNLTLGNLTLGNLTLGNLTLGNLTLGNLTLGNAAFANPSLIELGKTEGGFDDATTYGQLLEWAFDPANGVDPALLNPALLGLTLAKDEDGDGIVDNPEDLLNLTLGNLTLGNLTLGNLTLGNLTLGNLTLGNAAEPNLTLGNLTLGNLTLGNAAIDDPVLNETACPPNPDGSPAECEVSGLAYDDYTYPVTNKGNVTTGIDADITINGDVAATQLIAWSANVTATSISCDDTLLLDERVRAVVNNPDSILEVADIQNPFEGDISVAAGPGETVFFTLRVFGTPAQLRDVSVSGFTASSQAANCVRDGGGVVICSDNLNQGIEQILTDGPPSLTIEPAGDVTLEASSPSGADYSFTATAEDTIDPNPTVTCSLPFTNGAEISYTYPIGVTEVSCSAFDNAVPPNGVSKTITVTVEDTTAPEIFVNDADGVVEFAADDPRGSFVDLSGIVTATDLGQPLAVSCETSTGIGLPDWLLPGDYDVTCTASDGSSTSIDVSVTIVVDIDDNEAPVLTVPTTAVPAVGGPVTGTATVDYSALVSATDNVDTDVLIQCSPPSGSVFPAGDTVVSCTAFDDGPNASGGQNSVTRTFVVAVADTLAPVITLNGPNPDSIAQGTVYTDPGAIATDNVDGSFAATATLLDTSQPGTFTVTYTATDSAGNAAVPVTRSVVVIDATPPVISAPDRVVTADYVNPLDPDYAAVTDLERDVVATDRGLPVPVNCARDPGAGEPPIDPALAASEFEFSDLPYRISCVAIDSAGNQATASFLLTVRYLYAIELTAPKGRARAGSTIPLDFLYRDWQSASPVDGSGIMVRVAWAKMTDSSCSVRDLSSPEGSSGLGEDSGNSDFRYTASSATWQFSWQTPDVTGWHKVAVSPPGAKVRNAWECVNLR